MADCLNKLLSLCTSSKAPTVIFLIKVDLGSLWAY